MHVYPLKKAVLFLPPKRTNSLVYIHLVNSDVKNRQWRSTLRQGHTSAPGLLPLRDEEIATIFRAMDNDRNGKVDLKELHKFLKEHGQHRKRKLLKQYIKDIDLDGDGKITLWELTVALRNADCPFIRS
ncbi:hypothetical protein FGIG_03416 [Fasciola gigantica]|uniref:EF-hand domain-containing protein n=1 Tax=Fasciola gigantica TaxID=46835 RepID=A0A504YGA4_FASGI|nr:hypothetical protein FGIG_03416 [Fasciola gigantica]